MKRATKRHSSLFLIELMIALLFFSLATVICMRFFTQAHLISQGAQNLNEAVLIATSLAEEFRASNGQMNDKLLHYDHSWKLVESEQAIFTASFQTIAYSGNLSQATITISQNHQEIIYQLEVLLCP